MSRHPATKARAAADAKTKAAPAAAAPAAAAPAPAPAAAAAAAAAAPAPAAAPVAAAPTATADASTTRTAAAGAELEYDGRNVSRRGWKKKQPARSSALKQKPGARTYAERKAAALERREVMEKEAELVEARRARMIGAREKRDAKRARKQRAEYNNSQYQVITNETTVKSLSKKQMRNIKRTRMSKEGELEFVDAYAPTQEPKKRRR